jgi:hypothetical protein
MVETQQIEQPIIEKKKRPRARIDSTRFLDDASRNDIIKQLQDAGYDVEGVSDSDLLKKLTESNKELSKKVVERESGGLDNKLNEYAHGSILTNKELITNLYRWGVPKLYIKIFNNTDVTLTKEQIWEKVRQSGINPIESIAEIMKYRHPEKNRGKIIR